MLNAVTLVLRQNRTFSVADAVSQPFFSPVGPMMTERFRRNQSTYNVLLMTKKSQHKKSIDQYEHANFHSDFISPKIGYSFLQSNHLSRHIIVL